MLVKDHTTGHTYIDKTPTCVKYIDTGKVKIGCAYIPKPMRMSSDAELIQRAMLGLRVPLQDVLSYLVYYVVVFIAVVALLATAWT